MELHTHSAKYVKAVCKGCGESMAGLVERMEKHVNKCEKAQALFKQLRVPVASQENSSKKRAADKAFGIPKGQCDLTSMLSVSREKIWEQLCRFIVATNSSFSLVENEEFVKFVRLLKPGFVLPKRKQDAGALLDEVSEKELAAVKDNSSGKFGTVALDGWTSASAEPVLGVSVSFDNTTYLMDTIDTSGAAHTAAYVSEVCLAAVSKVEESLNIKVAAYVTDNASNMKAARDIVETKRPEILCYGCQAHQLNLLSKDLYKDAPKEKIIDEVIGVLKWFRVSHWQCCVSVVYQHHFPLSHDGTP